MTNEQILKQAIEKANKNGMDYELSGTGRIVKVFNGKDFVDAEEMISIYEFIFSHDFAKAFWGEKFDYFDKYDKKGVLLGELLWQYHTQQMVLEKEPLKYIEQFLDAHN